MSTLPPEISVTPSSLPGAQNAANRAHHDHRRWLIGPMPEKLINLKSKLPTGSEPNPSIANDESILTIIKDHAFSFFIREGGKEEDWGENAESGVKEEMLRQWSESEWGKIWRKRLDSGSKKKENKRWIGASFEVGEFLGVNILEEERAISLKSKRSNRSVKSGVPSAPIAGGSTAALATTNGEILTTPAKSNAHSASNTPQISAPADDPFIAGPSDSRPPQLLVLPDLASSEDLPTGKNSSLRRSVSPEISLQLVGNDKNAATTGLVVPHTPPPNKANADLITRSIFRSLSSTGAMSDDGTPNSKSKGKGKLVFFADDAPPTPGPAPPNEVLERTGSKVNATSAGAVADATPREEEIRWGDVVMRDRMLVRVSYTRSESIDSAFDEVQNRSTSHLQYEDWAEFMVAWRKDRIEIYEDYSLPGKEWLLGHKHLAFLIPLKSSRTKLSLYSFVDLTFCLICPPTPVDETENKARSLFHLSKEGTNIFVFKVKSRSRALDWMWQLWRQLGGQIPQYLEVRSSSLDTRIRIDIPSAIASSADYSMFTRDNIIALCVKVLKKTRDWRYIVEREIEHGKTLELAWRWKTNLDWIWLHEDDAKGSNSTKGRQDWSVLCGLALKQSGKPCQLEIRLADHFPHTLHLSSGAHLFEPASIEGYLDRIKPNTQTKQAVYLVTHDGNLFSLSPAKAHPPSPPGVGGGDMKVEDEVKRGANQIMEAIGTSDLKSIVAVRRAFQAVSRHTVELPPIANNGNVKRKKTADQDEWARTWAMETEGFQDEEDEGGEEGLARAADKGRLRTRRSFELLLTSGNVVRFEAHSSHIALEWINRLRDLITYWKHRHKIDAREEMDLAQISSRRPRLTPQMHTNVDERDIPPEPPADPDSNLPALGNLYNWCILDGCKSIVKDGKVYTRRGLRGQYKLVHLVLVSGNLVQFHVTPKSALHQRRKRIINLLDAYVCSGYFAALTLPRDQYSPTASSTPRRYQDGLEADDPEEDMLFILWYRPTRVTIDNKSPDKRPRAQHLALSAKRKVVVFRTRSKLERDAWCWALNCEIEKMVRRNSDREEILRETGKLIKI